MSRLFSGAGLFLACGAIGLTQPAWDNFSDTWVATDALGRKVAYHQAPRQDRKVGIFYFLWLGPHVRGGPFDIGKILTIDPAAMQEGGQPVMWPSLRARPLG